MRSTAHLKNGQYKEMEMFSNGTECMIWQGRNCDRCAKYKGTSVKAEDAGCRIAFYIDYGAVTGELPPDVEEAADRRDCPEFETFERKARREQREGRAAAERLCGQGYLFNGGGGKRW